DRHVLLPFYLGPGCPLWLADLVRGGLAAGGAALLLVVRPRLARRLVGGPLRGERVASALAAGLAALLATELILRVSAPDPASGSPRYELKVGQRHPRFGWVARASRTTVLSVGGRTYRYAVNDLGV